MEFVKVRFPTERDVIMDDLQVGKTNRKLVVGEGTHTFRLAGAANYTPPDILIVVTETTEEFPLELRFAHKVS